VVARLEVLQVGGLAQRLSLIARVGDPQRYDLPAIDRLGIVHVTDGGTRLYPAEVSEDDWVAFRACLWIHRWRKGKAA